MFWKKIFRNKTSNNTTIQKKLLSTNTTKIVKKRKQKIPGALQEATWIAHMGRVFQGKCKTPWCLNTINVFDFHAGHNIPESKGGPTTLENLVPICSRCNYSMGNRYTFEEWCTLSPSQTAVEVVEVENSSCCSCR